MPPTFRSADRLVIAPSQPRAGLLLVRLLGDLGPDEAARCTRVLHGAVDAAAAEHALRYDVRARVTCDVSEVGVLDESGLAVLADAQAYAMRLGVDFEVVTDDAGTPDDDLWPTVPAAR